MVQGFGFRLKAGAWLRAAPNQRVLIYDLEFRFWGLGFVTPLLFGTIFLTTAVL